MGPPPSNWPTTSPMTPVPMTPMHDISTAFAPINAQGGSTEPFWFKNQNNTISRASQSHQLSPASESMLYPGDAIPYVYPGDPSTSRMAHPQMRRPKRSTTSHSARSRAKKLKTSSSVACKTKSQGLQGAPGYLDVWQPPPSFSNMQQQRRRMLQHTPKWEMLDIPWLTCPWQHLGCPFSHKLKAQITRHMASCKHNPHPVLQKCDRCEDAAYTRINRLFEHYQTCTHNHPQENQ